jgi:hypothetical protein
MLLEASPAMLYVLPIVFEARGPQRAEDDFAHCFMTTQHTCLLVQSY